MLSCHAILGTRPSRRMLPGLRADPPAVRPQTTPSRYRAVHLREWSDVAGLTLFRRHGAVASDVEVSSEWNLDELLDWAVDREVVSRADARLLADVYAVKPEARGSCRDVSEAYVSHAASSGVSQARPATAGTSGQASAHPGRADDACRRHATSLASAQNVNAEARVDGPASLDASPRQHPIPPG